MLRMKWVWVAALSSDPPAALISPHSRPYSLMIRDISLFRLTGVMARRIGKYHLGPMIGEGAYGQYVHLLLVVYNNISFVSSCCPVFVATILLVVELLLSLHLLLTCSLNFLLISRSSFALCLMMSFLQNYNFIAVGLSSFLVFARPSWFASSNSTSVPSCWPLSP